MFKTRRILRFLSGKRSTPKTENPRSYMIRPPPPNHRHIRPKPTSPSSTIYTANLSPAVHPKQQSTRSRFNVGRSADSYSLSMLPMPWRFIFPRTFIHLSVYISRLVAQRPRPTFFLRPSSGKDSNAEGGRKGVGRGPSAAR